MDHAIYEKYHLRPVINGSGTLTAYGQSSARPEAIEASAQALPLFFEMDHLHARASEAIARISGAEAGFITACAAAGITLSIASCMAGTDPARVAQLPDAYGMKNEVLIQFGHCCNFGAPITQMIRLAGAQVRTVGTVNGTGRDLLAASFGPETVAAVYVISHHTTQYGMVPLADFVEIAHAAGVPVVVDAAAEEALLSESIEAGADIVICSGHKHFRGPTAGVVAGRLELIQGCYAQNRGIGRPMKIGKEGVLGMLAALEVWEKEDSAAARAEECDRVDVAVAHLSGVEGIGARPEIPPSTTFPITRLRVEVEPAAGLSALALVTLLAEEDPSIRVRGHHVDEGYFFVDPFVLTKEEMLYICERIEAIVSLPEEEKARIRSRFDSESGGEQWTHRPEWPFYSLNGQVE